MPSSSISASWLAGPWRNTWACRSSAPRPPCRSISTPVSRPSTPWSHRPGHAARLRNWTGNTFTEWLLSPILRAINGQRYSWRLGPLDGMNASFSRLAHVAQLPAALELPGRRLPPGFHYTGPWTDPTRAGAGGLPLVAPRPQPTTRVRLDGNAPERRPADLPAHRRGVRGARPAARDLP